MKINRKYIIVTTALAGLLLGALAPSIAQAQSLDSSTSESGGATASGGGNSAAPQSTPTAPSSGPSAKDEWQTDATFYGWLAGVHGNVDALGHDLGYKASFGDLISHVDFGLMAAVSTRYKSFVMTGDFFWITLSDTKGRNLDLANSLLVSANVKSRPVIFTPKIGYRLIDQEKVKLDFLAGIRFWHLGTTLNLTPSPLGKSPYVSNNWVDPLIGSRIQVPLSPKLMATIAGDVGGWGAGAQMDYQIVGALSYKVKPKLALDAGWRYLYVDYTRTHFTNELAMSGLILGATYSFSPQ